MVVKFEEEVGMGAGMGIKGNRRDLCDRKSSVWKNSFS
jgi:hypothetical protein